MELEDKLEKEFNEIADSKFNEYISLVSDWFVSINGKDKFEIEYGTNYYDNSGEIKCVGKININDYELLEEFCEEHNGEKHATYTSGYGWAYNSYDDDLMRMTREFISEKVQIELINLKKSQDENFWINELNGYSKEYDLTKTESINECLDFDEILRDLPTMVEFKFLDKIFKYDCKLLIEINKNKPKL